MRKEQPIQRTVSTSPIIRFRVAPGVQTAWYGRQIVLHLGQRSYYTLNGLAPRMWGLFVRGTSPGLIIAQLRREVGAPVEQIEVEVAAVLARLLAAGLINPQTR